MSVQEMECVLDQIPANVTLATQAMTVRDDLSLRNFLKTNANKNSYPLVILVSDY
jgi:hypothetical protein